MRFQLFLSDIKCRDIKCWKWKFVFKNSWRVICVRCVFSDVEVDSDGDDGGGANDTDKEDNDGNADNCEEDDDAYKAGIVLAMSVCTSVSLCVWKCGILCYLERVSVHGQLCALLLRFDCAHGRHRSSLSHASVRVSIMVMVSFNLKTV